jgi:hypothetical protein
MRLLIIFDVGSNFILNNEPKRMRWAEDGGSVRE